LKSIPLNDSESEDEVTSGDEDFVGGADADFIDEESDEDEYERKWSKKVNP
jgi:hypothetical protein